MEVDLSHVCFTMLTTIHTTKLIFLYAFRLDATVHAAALSTVGGKICLDCCSVHIRNTEPACTLQTLNRSGKRFRMAR